MRAAAGLTMVLDAVAFAPGYFDANYLPLKVVTTLFFVEFLIRVTAGLKYSPMGLNARALTQRQPPEWVSAKPKRFAWTIGLVMSFSMMIITNSGATGALPRTICPICLVLLWLESVLGCASAARSMAGWCGAAGRRRIPAFEVCAHGACELPAREPAPAATLATR